MSDRVHPDLVSRLLTRVCRQCKTRGLHRIVPQMHWDHTNQQGARFVAIGLKANTTCPGANIAWEQRVAGDIRCG